MLLGTCHISVRKASKLNIPLLLLLLLLLLSRLSRVRLCATP